jgi:hypothetical protein
VWYAGEDCVYGSVVKVTKNMPLVLVYSSEDYWDGITANGTPVYSTAEQAKLALQWRKFDELRASLT